MQDNKELLKIIKKIALDAVEAGKPTAISFGTVTSSSPLKINVEQKMTLSSAQLILTRNVTDYQVSMTVNHVTEHHEHDHTITGGDGEVSKETHNHGYVGTKTFTVHNGLKVGEEVIMLQMQGGQKYIVWDRV